MRTADICPTCATYINALCVIYNGVYLSTIDVEPLDSLEVALGKINTFLGTIQPSLGFTPENVANKSTDITLGGATPSDVLYPSQKAVKNYVDNTIASSGLITVKVSLTSANILNFNGTNTFQLLAGQGVGTITNVHNIWMRYNFVTTAYTGGGDIYVTMGPYDITPTMSNVLILNSAVTVGVIAEMKNITAIDPVYQNLPVVLNCSAVQTLGDGTLDVYITYSVISL